MSAPETQRERQRLKILWEYQVLDTVPEEVFDQLTELAAHICEAPIALISLVDENRQWFKSKVGISLSQTSRDVSFCAHAIRQSGLFLISDATKDPRFAQNPLVVSDPKIRFYAGAPLVTPDGHALGTLCVIDTVPRKLKPDQQQAMQVLARHVVSQLELRRRTRELVEVRAAREKEAANVRRLRAELAQARRELARLQRRKPSRRLSGSSQA